MRRAWLFGLMAYSAAAAIAADKPKSSLPSPADGRPGADIPFIYTTKIRGWAYDAAHKAVYFIDSRSQSYYVSFIGGCPELANARGFQVDTHGSTRLDHFGSFTVDDVDDTVCQIDRLVEADLPVGLKIVGRR